ncbi:hypothetical protein DKZ27_09330 [Limosilactobacillus reuteri]|uniref:Uncharacterized protein n=1 Tax=Limosilactobacillus reuteri TaxID=1598 RepID=A0ABD6Y412_LIMRT|nr:hypothetical protein [Limosilactobacillus reuteri]MCT3202758.1 hypothetical protein [Limosilactobacillus reuteri]MCT3211405.1 hypothetical protein [Limosilactobacillus reuteri]PWT29916.1 hypothetical protein DKZ27_09330 [Limosilactobacillus reuteri]PWT36492.1 hypothetical protein DKZ35_10060 [Limosilactobacillus reuteri]
MSSFKGRCKINKRMT